MRVVRDPCLRFIRIYSLPESRRAQACGAGNGAKVRNYDVNHSEPIGVRARSHKLRASTALDPARPQYEMKEYVIYWRASTYEQHEQYLT